MATIFHRFKIKTSDLHRVYHAITTQEGLAGWWTAHVSAKPGEGSVATFRFTPEYEKHMRVEVLSPAKFVKWRCIKGDEEWVDTVLTFDIIAAGDHVELEFRHGSWKSQTPLFGWCSYQWALYMKSLKDLVETGKGHPHRMD